jgi:hypothetical protein
MKMTAFVTGNELASRLVDEMLSFCPDCGKSLDALSMCPDTSTADAIRGLSYCGAGRTIPSDHPGCCSCERCDNTRKLLN